MNTFTELIAAVDIKQGQLICDDQGAPLGYAGKDIGEGDRIFIYPGKENDYILPLPFDFSDEDWDQLTG